MIQVYTVALLLVTTFAVGVSHRNGNSGALVGYTLLLPVFARALGWV